MAKKDYQFLTTGIGALVVGGTDQVLIDLARRGKLGSIGPADTQVVVASIAAIAGGTAHVLAKRQNAATRLGDGALYSGLALLGQSTMHWADKNYLMKGVAAPAQTQIPVNDGSSGSSALTTGSSNSASSNSGASEAASTATAATSSSTLSSANEDEG